jgi:transcriptional regulator with XRE-family HTH domain
VEVYWQEVGRRLRALREAKGMRQADVAKEIGGYSAVAIGHFERGRSRVPPEVLLWYSRFFGVGLDYLLLGTEQPEDAVSPMRLGEAMDFAMGSDLKESLTDNAWREMALRLARAMETQSEANRRQAEANEKLAEAQLEAQKQLSQLWEHLHTPLAPGRGGADAAQGDD